MAMTEIQKKAKRIIENQYLKYIQNCLKTGEEALSPEKWIEKKFKKGKLTE